MKKLCFIISFLFTCVQAFASHNKAGEITYRLVSGFEYEVTLVTYTENGNTTSQLADRPEVVIFWGDGSSNTVQRNIQLTLPNNTWKNIYIARHTYVGSGEFTIFFLDPNRIGAIVNMSNSFYTAFYVESKLKVSPFFGTNQSPVLLLPPIDFACIHKKFVHNPGAYDTDGDSIHFSIIPPKQNVGQDVFGFFVPPSMTINSQTGELIWADPEQVGIFNVAILIREFRNGVQIGYVIRDMQITVSNCNNSPPVIDPINDTCIMVGQTLMMNSSIVARDPGDIITLSAYGGPFEVATNKAVLSPAIPRARNLVTASFSWTPDCSHIRKFPYPVIIRAEDERFSPDVSLVGLEYFNVTVVAPAPRKPEVKQFRDGLELKWEVDTCLRAVGYNIYRRIDSSKWVHSTCETGVPAYTGFTLLDTVMGYQNNTYYDDGAGEGLAPGLRYCYRVTAFYAPRGNNNVPIFSSIAESYASIEICAEIIKDRPVITNVSVLKTDVNTGRIFLAWSKPVKVDSIIHPGPYKYVIYRSDDFEGKNFKAIDSLSNPSFKLFNDSTYIDTLLNTRQKPYSYKIEFYSDSFGLNRQYLGKSPVASSVFLSHIPDDESLILTWKANVKWVNYRFDIFRWNENTLQFDSIGTTTATTYKDENLVNGKMYKYYVKTIGKFNSPGYVFPVINLSEEREAIPWDTTAPCPPVLSATGECQLFRSRLGWTNPNNFCTDDVVKYRIYFRSIFDTSFALIDTVDGASTVSYLDERDILKKSIAGCYLVTAVDSFNNESRFSNARCVDNCPEYRLPNVFTPNNGDTFNNLFGPFPYRFVDKVDMDIFNRWGQRVFHTSDPDIRWDGHDIQNKQEVTEGVYFYICEVYELRLEGVKRRTLKGHIHLIK